MASTLLALANPAFLAPVGSQSQAELEHQQRVVAEYLAASEGYEEEEARLSDEEEDERMGDASAGEGMVVGLGEDEDEDEGEDEDAEGEVDVEAFLSTHLGSLGWEKKGKKELHATFLSLREKLYDTELQLASNGTGYVPRWGPANEDDEEEMEEEDSAANLAGWLGKLTDQDLEKTKAEEVVWWLVDMCKVLDGLVKELKGEL